VRPAPCSRRSGADGDDACVAAFDGGLAERSERAHGHACHGDALDTRALGGSARRSVAGFGERAAAALHAG
jgi:hypothetical protein